MTNSHKKNGGLEVENAAEGPKMVSWTPLWSLVVILLNVFTVLKSKNAQKTIYSTFFKVD